MTDDPRSWNGRSDFHLMTPEALMDLLESGQRATIVCPVGHGDRIREQLEGLSPPVGEVNVQESENCPAGRVLFLPPRAEDQTP